MRVVTDANETIELGETATAPTIGIVDYSRRTTDAFGVTTVVERGFARRMSVRVGVPFESVDTVQRRLAALRATPAKWVADERFGSLAFRGFYKDFDLDLATPPLSTCTLTVEGVAASEVVADMGGDAAPAGQSSTLQLLQPTIVGEGILLTSTVLENDAPGWAAGTTYAKGARVIRGNAHRIFESLIAANVGNDPTTQPGKWIDIGPTNRWAMFDQALGTSTTAANSISVTLRAGTVDAVALLDQVGATIRVQAPGYDRTLPVGPGTATFLDMPAGTGDVTVSIAGPGQVSIGTLLIGRRVSLGLTEASPTAGITDFSRKEVDDFGEVTIVQRAWAKRMTAKALIRTDAVDLVFSRIASVRARPALWIGQAGLDCLTIYGFFKDFEIEAGESVSKLSLSIEGLSNSAGERPALILVDRGIWDSNTVYRIGDVVLRAGATWRYIGTRPSSGIAPPQLPIEQNGQWRLLARAGSDGENGLSAYSAVLDNETHTLPADAAGNVTSYAGAEFTVQILYGSTDVTGSFHLDSVDNPQDLFGPDLYPTYRIDGGLDAAEDAAVVTYGFRGNAGTPHANVLLTKAFSLAKSKGGLDGSAPALISMSASSSIVKYSAADVMTTGDITMVTVRSNTAGTPRFTLTSFDGTVHGVANAPAQQLKDTFGDQVFGTTGPDVLILRAGWLNTIMQSFGGGLRVTVGIAGGSDTVTIIKVRDGVKGDNAPALTVTPSVSQLLVGQDGNYVGGQSFSLNVTRVELPGVPVFRRSDGYSNTAAGFAQIDPSSFSTTGPDNLTISPAGAVANMDAFGGTAGRLTFGVSVPGSAVTATATIQKVRDGVAGADGFIADSDAPVFVIECYSNGTPKPSWTGGRGSIRLTKGGGMITAGVTYSVGGQQNIASLALNGSTFSFAGLTADTGQFIINAIFNGVAYSRVISVKKVRDGSAAFRSEATFSANSNAASGTGNTTVPQARTVTISGYASYFAKSPGPGQTFGAVGYLSLFWRNVTDNGPDNLLGTVQGSEARTVNRSGNAAEPDYDAIGGQVAGAFQFTSPSPDKQIAYRAEFSSNGSAGSVYGSVALEIL